MAGSVGGTNSSQSVSSRDRRPAGIKASVAWAAVEGMDLAAWIRVGQRLGAMTRCSQWWLGDWIRYGNARWGEKYKEASRITGYDVQSLRNIAYVAGQINSSRRRDDLTWSHHAEVCALSVEKQEGWLDLAASERLSVADLRIELRTARRKENDTVVSSPAKLATVTCPECEHQFEVLPA